MTQTDPTREYRATPPPPGHRLDPRAQVSTRPALPAHLEPRRRPKHAESRVTTARDRTILPILLLIAFLFALVIVTVAAIHVAP